MARTGWLPSKEATKAGRAATARATASASPPRRWAAEPRSTGRMWVRSPSMRMTSSTAATTSTMAGSAAPLMSSAWWSVMTSDMTGGRPQRAAMTTPSSTW